MKRNTKKCAKKLGGATVRLIRGTPSMAKRIASLGGFKDHTFVSHVVAGRKQPTLKFWVGLDKALEAMRLEISSEIVHREHPEMNASTQG